MTTSPQSPQSAPSYLESLSGDIRAAVLLDAEGATVAHAGAGEPEEVGELVAEVLAQVDEASGERTAEIEVLTGSGTVFAVRGERYAIAAVTSRVALNALVRWDMRHLIARVEAA